MSLIRKDKKAFVKYTKDGKLVPGSLLLGTTYPKDDGVWLEITEDLCCDFEQKGTGNGIKKAYVNYSNGHVVPGSLIIGDKLCPPKMGCWREIPVNFCCIPVGYCNKGLFLTGKGVLYLYNFDNNTYKTLTLPNFPTLGAGLAYLNLIHNRTKLYLCIFLTGPSRAVFYEWDISLPYLTATYVKQFNPLNGNYVAGSCASQTDDLKGYILRDANPPRVEEIDFTTNPPTATPLFNLSSGTSISIGGDLIQTTSGKFILVARNILLVTTPIVIQQYSSTGILEFETSLGSSNYHYSILEANSEIYVVSYPFPFNSSGVSSVYKVNSTPPYTVTLVNTIPYNAQYEQIFAASQLPECCVKELQIV